nr:hypothetical protein BaRGS_008743 [Batillaria attramentaria]
MSFASKKKYDKVRPVVYVPVGEKADKDLMKSMATLSTGVYMEPKDVQKLCGYFSLQETIGKTMACLKNQKHSEELSDSRIIALATSLMPGLDEEQKKEVVEVVKKELKNPTKKYRSRLSDLEDVHEDTGWTYVAWDHGGHNRYAYGPDQGYHIWKTDEHPRFMEDDGELKIGMTVEKGPDWNYTEEKLQHVRTGVVVRKSRSEKKVMVRWDNGEMHIARWGADNKYDVRYCRRVMFRRMVEKVVDGGVECPVQRVPVCH